MKAILTTEACSNPAPRYELHKEQDFGKSGLDKFSGRMVSSINRLTNLEHDRPDSEALGLMINSTAAAPADQAILRGLPASALLRLAIV